MQQPSLLVLIVGGWAQAASGPGNLFAVRGDGYFEELLASYPTLFLSQLDGPAKLERIYKSMGSLVLKDKPSLSLMEILHGHSVQQVCIADADRYGLLTQALHLGRQTPREQEKWQYIPMPPGERLVETPGSSTPFVVEACLQAMKQEKNSVVFACLNAPWSVGLGQQLAATREAVAQTQQAVKQLVEKALDRSIRVLLLGDEGLAESYVSQDLKIHPLPTDNPLPCLLIHSDLEGLTAASGDQVEAMQAGRAQVSATWNDIAPTILALMDIPPRPHATGKILFAPYVERLRKQAAGGPLV